MQRRDFFSALVAAGATPKAALAGKPLKHRRCPSNERLYHGPFLIPAHIAEILRESPEVYKCRGGGQKLALRYVDTDETTWLIRSRIPATRAVVGEIVRTPEGRVRVHCWSAARPGMTYREVGELLARRDSSRPTASDQIETLEDLSPPAWDMQTIPDDDLPSMYLPGAR